MYVLLRKGRRDQSIKPHDDSSIKNRSGSGRVSQITGGIFPHWTNPWGYLGSDRLLVRILTMGAQPVGDV